MGKRAAVVTLGLVMMGAATWIAWTLLGRIGTHFGDAITEIADSDLPRAAAATLARSTRIAPEAASNREADDGPEERTGVRRPPPVSMGRTFTLIPVDALTGERLSCSWGAGGGTANAGEPCALNDDRMPLHFRVSPPSGHMVWRLEGFGTEWAWDATRAEAILPLHVAMVLEVTVLDPEGAVSPSSRFYGTALGRWGNERTQLQSEVVTPGTHRFRPIPFFPGESVISVYFDEEDGDLVGALDTAIPPRPPTVWRETVHLHRLSGIGALADAKPSTGSTHFGKNEEPEPQPPRLGTIRAHVLDSEGAPQPSAAINGTVADAEGRVVLGSLPVGPYRVSARVTGRLPASAVVTVRPDETVDVTLQEPEGARLDVIVVDEEGRPRPSALLSLESGWFDVRDGVQRLDLFTDRLGRRSLSRVEPGAVTVTATWGGRSGSGTVTLRDGGRATVRIVAK